MFCESDDDLAIAIKNVSKKYLMYDRPSDRFFQLFKREPIHKEFWAIQSVSLRIRKGETTAIIGRNGAGKSTLLQLICGTITPTSGEVIVNGKIAALLELGAGFNPNFTGKENVYLSAGLHGLSKSEIREKFDSILRFADIGEFINRPVKSYSSGMFVRLAFAVIAHVDADILIVDEALSVGDAFFQQKCMRFLSEFQKNGGTLLFVSHDMSAVISLCENAILLKRDSSGYHYSVGLAKDISKIYLKELYETRESPVVVDNNPYPPHDLNTQRSISDDLNYFHAVDQRGMKII